MIPRQKNKTPPVTSLGGYVTTIHIKMAPPFSCRRRLALRNSSVACARVSLMCFCLFGWFQLGAGLFLLAMGGEDTWAKHSRIFFFSLELVFISLLTTIMTLFSFLRKKKKSRCGAFLDMGILYCLFSND